jgi:hypothetical protein
MKLCKDCRWILPPEGENARCASPTGALPGEGAVTGKTVERRHDCLTLLLEVPGRPGITCGPRGDLFEPKDDKPVGSYETLHRLLLA